MKRRILCSLLPIVCLAATGLADTWTGHVAAADLAFVEAPANGVLESFAPELGMAVHEGDVLGGIRLTRVFAPEAGRIEAVHLDPEDEIDGATVLDIDPLYAYDVECTSDGAARTRENMLVHSGETLFMRCTAGGEHQARGRVTRIDGNSYSVQVTEGKLCIGETVRLYRDQAYTEEDCVGSGEVKDSQLISVSGSGKLLRLFVNEGDTIQRGQLLWTSASKKNTVVTAPADGLVTEVLAKKGDVLAENDVLAKIATGIILSVPVKEEDADIFQKGAVLRYYRADDPHEVLHDAVVIRVLHSTSDAAMTVEFTAEETKMPIGLTVTVTDE